MRKVKKFFILIGSCLLLTGCSSSLVPSEITSFLQPAKHISPEITLSADAFVKPKQYTVAIDAGHQQKGNSELEPIGPGASERKAKVAGGTSGISTKVPEYQLTLDISLLLKQELLNRGYEVIMIREQNEVNISNAERAEIANRSGADIFIRVHANGDNNRSVSGALTIAPSQNNRYVKDIAVASRKLSESIIASYCDATGFKNRGVLTSDTMSGINWCKIPVTIIELGFMTNPAEDKNMQNTSTQNLMVSGIANGIDAFFNRLDRNMILEDFVISNHLLP